MKNTSILILLTVFSMHFAMAQRQEKCLAEILFREAAAKDPSLLQRREELERETERYIEQTKAMKASSVVRVIPVVFHVMHENGPENISKDQILDQLRIMNEYFNFTNADTTDIPSEWRSRAANCELEFRLATKDPQGNCTDGITRTFSSLTNNARDNVKSVIRWDTQKYLNVWIVKNIENTGGASGTILGFAQFPGQSPATDGVVVRNDCIGSIGTAAAGNLDRKGHTIIHEVGHYLNLFHIWGDDNNTCNNDDQVTDTPKSQDAVFGCPSFPQTDNCTAVAPGIMFMNFMDYTDCGVMFTKGQKLRMESTLNGPRATLSKASNLAATGTDVLTAPECRPKSEFASDKNLICAGDSVFFTDKSWNASPNVWQWTFEGGSPSTSNLQNPRILYTTPGNYFVKMVVKNAAGADSITKSGVIYVSSNTAAYNTSLVEGFEAGTLPNSDWKILGEGGKPWKISNAAATGAFSATLNNFNHSGGTVDELISPSVDLSGWTQLKMKFKVAYARKPNGADADDILRVFVSRDCGKTWLQRYSKDGAKFALAAATGSSFTPSGASQWKEETVNIVNATGGTNVTFKFQFNHSPSANNIYIDDINIYDAVSVDELTPEDIGMNVFPNPSAGNSELAFSLSKAELTEVQIRDITGREVWSRTRQLLPPGNHRIGLASDLAPGVYLVVISKAGMNFMQKMIIEK
jgi:PKD repeat protein